MSILTKICVVLLLIVTLVASTVFTKLAVTAPSWRQAYDKQVLRAEVADQASAVHQMALQRALLELSRTVEARKELEKDLATAKKDAAADKAAAEQRNNKLSTDIEALKADLAKVQLGLEKENAELKLLNAEKARLQKTLAETNDVARQYKGELDETITQRDRLTKLAKHRAEQIRDLQAENAELTDKLRKPGVVATTDQAVALLPAAGPKITGTVTAVGDGVASINIGRAKGVRKNMMLKVYRGGHFVAHLRIDMVETNTSAGVVLDKRLDVVQGDKVATDLK